jgi:hypothetical protein
MGARLDDCSGSGIAGHLVVQFKSPFPGDSKAAEAIRDLVETVTVFREPSRPGGVTVEIAGCLNALRGERAYPNEVHKRFGLKPDRLAADTAYRAAPILNWLVDAKSIAPHIPKNERMAPSRAATFDMIRQTTSITVPRGRP